MASGSFTISPSCEGGIQPSSACIVHLKMRRGIGLRHFHFGFATLAAWRVALLCSRPSPRLAHSGPCTASVSQAAGCDVFRRTPAVLDCGGRDIAFEPSVRDVISLTTIHPRPKAASHSVCRRTPRRFAFIHVHRISARFWTAAALRRFPNPCSSAYQHLQLKCRSGMAISFEPPHPNEIAQRRQAHS